MNNTKINLAIRIENMEQVKALEKYYGLKYCGFGRQLTYFRPNGDGKTYGTPDISCADNYDTVSFPVFAFLMKIEIPKEPVIIFESCNFNVELSDNNGLLFKFASPRDKQLVFGSELDKIYSAYKSINI